MNFATVPAGIALKTVRTRAKSQAELTHVFGILRANAGSPLILAYTEEGIDNWNDVVQM